MHEIIQRLTEHKATLLNETKIMSSVLIVLVLEQQIPKNLILLQRSKHLNSYSGDICFPGGIKENEDINLLDTAIRETHEEIGLKINRTQIISQCNDFLDSQHRLVRPYIATVTTSDVTQLTLSAELEKLYYFPLTELLAIKEDLQNVKVSKRKPSYIYQGNEYLIWGLTASILMHLRNIIYQSNYAIGYTCA